MQDKLVYLLFKHAIFILKLFPDFFAYGIVRLLALLPYYLDRRHFKIARYNLLNNLLDYPDNDKVKEIVKGMYANFMSIPLDLELSLRRIRKYNWKRWITIDHEEFLNDKRENTKYIVLPLHLGNWEVGGPILSMYGFKVYVIHGTLGNKFLDEYLNFFRNFFGEEVIFKAGALKNILSGYNESDRVVIAMLIDQHGGARGVNIRFFKDEASTLRTPAILYKRWRIPILCAASFRVKNFKFCIKLQRLAVRKNENVKEILQTINNVFEKFIKEAPSQWLWTHRRWNYPYKKIIT
jgi:lauroyl/myristoyl acyltransferase